MFAGLGVLGLTVGVLEAVNLGAFFPILYALLGTDAGQAPSRGQAVVIEGIRRILTLVPVAEPFLAACTLLVALTVVKAALALLHEYLTANTTGRLLHGYRQELIQRLSRAPLQTIEDSRVGALVHDLIQPPIMLARLLYTLPRLIIDLLRVVFVLGLLVYVEPAVSIGLAAFAVALYLAMSRRLSVYLYQLGLQRRHVELDMNNAANEWLHGIRYIRIGGADGHWLRSFARASRTAQSTYIRSFFLLSSPRHLFELAGFLLLIAGLMLAYRFDPVDFKGHVVVFGIFAVGLVRILPSVAALVRGPLDIRNTIP
ncbi:MAG: ABC transporter transmembrane domain-containing protein, partial [Pseudomonadota bacterium]